MHLIISFRGNNRTNNNVLLLELPLEVLPDLILLSLLENLPLISPDSEEWILQGFLSQFQVPLRDTKEKDSRLGCSPTLWLLSSFLFFRQVILVREQEEDSDLQDLRQDHRETLASSILRPTATFVTR